jgi:hypothetical protein
MTGISVDLIDRALAKLKGGQVATSVAAIFVGDLTANDLDGVHWRFVVTDGSTIGTVDGGIAGSKVGARGMAVNEADLERRVEREAGRFPVDTRMDDLLAASPLVL